jgi:protein gp37
MNKTGIEYLDFTWNPTHGCSRISAGCDNCWAEFMAKKLAAWGAPGYDPQAPFNVTLHPGRLDEPLKRKKPARIGVSFMGDLFHGDVSHKFIRQIFDVMIKSDHTFIILTKRPLRMESVLVKEFSKAQLNNMDNIWFGVTAESQIQADNRIPALLKIPVKNHWVSVEPMLEKIDLYQYLICDSCLDPSVCWCRDPRVSWVVCGGESGSGARALSLDWVISLKGQCKRAGTPFMFKQLIRDGRKISAPKISGKQYMEIPK